MSPSQTARSPAPLLRIDTLTNLLSQLVSPQAAPHTAIIVSRAGAVIASQSVTPSPPFPVASLPERGDDERALAYAAVASSRWLDVRGPRGEGVDGKTSEPLMLENEFGRIAVVELGSFLLVLVGSEISPWPVLDKKLRLAAEVLREPLERIPG